MTGGRFGSPKRCSVAAQNMKPPLNGDEAAIRKYAKDMEALRKKVGD